MINRFRDLSIVDFGSVNLVVANDSSGAIGSKENDLLKADPEVVAYHGAEVALMEVIAYGADPVLLVNNLMVEMNPTGKQMIRGIKKSMESVGMDPDKSINGSTEENFPTSQTGIGITVIGTTEKKGIPIYNSQRGDIVVALGKPLVGEQVLKADSRDMMSSKKLLKIRSLPYINELLPVGSTGIIQEMKEIEKTAGLKAVVFKSGIDLEVSGGPSTCVLATLKNEFVQDLDKNIDILVTPIAILV